MYFNSIYIIDNFNYNNIDLFNKKKKKNNTNGNNSQ